MFDPHYDDFDTHDNGSASAARILVVSLLLGALVVALIALSTS